MNPQPHKCQLGKLLTRTTQPNSRKGTLTSTFTGFKEDTCSKDSLAADQCYELKIFGMSSRHHIDDFMRGRIIGKIEEGQKITGVAREFDIAQSVVSRLWKSFKTTGMCSRRHGKVVLEQVANQFLAASGKQISRKTVARRLRGGGLYASRPVVYVPLTKQHRTARLQWCREHHNWTEQDWGHAYYSQMREKDRYPTCSIIVWAGIMINGRTRIHVVANGTMTGQRYIDKVLLPHVSLFRGAVGDKFVLMNDNATCHRTLAVQDCLDSEGIQRLVWPVRSPDLNPIENVCNALGRQVAGRNYPPINKNTLNHALTEEWDKLPQQLLDSVVQSMLQSHKIQHGGPLPSNRVVQKTTSQRGDTSQAFSSMRSPSSALVPPLNRLIYLQILTRCDEAHFWLNGYVNKQNCRFWSEANPQVYVETPLHPEKLTVWCALWAGGILLQKR
ncbi:transposable element Tcb2 transposase [Trichonephila clavipes]|nr:transposable element Tcb2 transposase [Trichonephila clavipes]